MAAACWALCPCTSSDRSTPSARVRFQRVAKVGLVWPRSIWLNLERETPDITANSSRVSFLRLRNWWRRGPRRGGSLVKVVSGSLIGRESRRNLASNRAWRARSRHGRKGEILEVEAE